MNRIVHTGLKIDLHIHSCKSSHKDGQRVKNNTIENLPNLVRKLDEQNVNICAITDHDIFSYSMYSTLKKSEQENCSIKKVLPGVEFSVKFNSNGNVSVIHVIAIFSDTDDTKVETIESILNKNRPDSENAYSETKFLKILREINIDTILIAHQKNTLSSKKPRKNDANSLGQGKFLEFVFTDYFEAFEFKNKRNEVLNKVFLSDKKLEESVRLITGTDCHDWNYYPLEDSSDVTDEFPYTFAKCLPTFRGLVMAITDHERLKTVNSFFSTSEKYLKSLKIQTQENILEIPFSRGINVIVGDNSIGKSLLLHTMTRFSKSGTPLPSNVKKGYEKYLKEHHLKILTQVPESDLFCFDMQGEVRAKFEENKLDTSKFLGEYFPKKIDSRQYRTQVENEINRMLSYLKEKFSIDSLIQKLAPHELVLSDKHAESITFIITNLKKSKQETNSITATASKLGEVIVGLKELKNLSLDDADLEYISTTIELYQAMKNKYERRIQEFETENIRIEKIATVITKVSERHKRNISDTQKKVAVFAETTTSLIHHLIEIIKRTQTLPSFIPCIESTPITPLSNMVLDYEFISKLNIEKVDSDYFDQLVKSLLKSKKTIDWDTVTETELQNMLLRYDSEIPVIDFIREKLQEKLDEDFKNKNSIINQGTDKYQDMSSGLDAKIYFDLLSHETNGSGIYIIDQPEDNISQSSIKILLTRFKTMAENRQIIMITHNPQFIVNLDADNIIFMTKQNDQLYIQSGALEYSSGEYNILDIIAKNIDGGLSTIRKRWKRYEKITNI